MALKKKLVNQNAGLASSDVMRDIDILPGNTDGVKNLKAVSRSLIAFHENNDYRELDNEEDIQQLAEAIKRQGLLDNLVVVQRPSKSRDQAGKKYVLLSGERRLRAINLLCSENPDLEPQFATVTCNVLTDDYFKLPAERMANLHDNGYGDDEIRDIQEMIVIDEANLQRRGGVGNEKQQRKAAARYSKNLMIIYGLSQKDADYLTKRISGQSARATEINLKLERHLTEPLRDLLDRDILQKSYATRFSALDIADQEMISNALTSMDRVLIQEDGNPKPEFSETVSAIARALDTRNEREREEALNEAIDATKKKVADIRRKQQSSIQRPVIRSDKHEKLMNNIHILQRRVEIMSKPGMIEDLARDDVVNGGDNTFVNNLDRIIKSLQSIRDQIGAEVDKINKR